MSSAAESGDLDYDVGLLVAERPSLIDASVFVKPLGLQLVSSQSKEMPKEELEFLARREEHIMKSTQLAAQGLVSYLFQLQTESTEAGVVASLPAPNMSLPRYRRCPAKKEETRWEKYAREKGIVKRKRSRMVWDESSQAWVPRHGYGSKANKLAKDWLIEDSADQAPGSDPFDDRARDRKLKVLQNEERRLGNARKQARAQETKGIRAVVQSASSSKPMAGTAALPVGIPAQLSVAEGHVAGLTGQGRGPRARPAGEGVQVKRDRLRAAAASTASMGRFDRAIKGAPKAKPRRSQATTGRLPNESTKSDKDRALGVLKSMHAKQDRAASAPSAAKSGDGIGPPIRGKGSNRNKRRRVG